MTSGKLLHFRARFVTEARATIESLAALEEPGTLRAALHKLVGEAALVGLPEIATLGRSAAHAAARWADTSTPMALTECHQILRQIGDKLREL